MENTENAEIKDARSGSLERLVSLQPETRYTKEGVSVDIDCVKDGEVYVRRWPKGVKSQPFFSNNCIRMTVSRFVEQVQFATMETNEKLCNSPGSGASPKPETL